MKLSNSRPLHKKGFTLIEVVLVLAVGGLIFLLAFIAFQQVSINRRDTQRRAAAGTVLAELQNYYSDVGRYPENVDGIRGSMTNYDDIQPDSARNFYTQYLGDESFIDPGGQEAYAVTYGNDDTVADHPNAVRYVIGYKCDPNTAANVGISPEPSSIAVQITLEKGLVCRDSR